MKLKSNKKGFVNDTLIAMGAFIVIILVSALVSLMLFNFNTQIQNADVGNSAKEASAESVAVFPNYINYGFAMAFIGFMAYTLITALLINNIHPIFWIVGFVLVIISTIITSTIKLIYGVIEAQTIIAPYIANIPLAAWYFGGAEIINIVWMGIQLTIVYFAWDRG